MYSSLQSGKVQSAQMLPNDEPSLANEDWKQYASYCFYDEEQDSDQLLLK